MTREDQISALLADPKGGSLWFDTPVPDGAITAVVYARRSKDGGRGVQDQTKSLMRWAERDGYHVVALVVEHGSASIYAHEEREYWPEVVEIITSRTARLLLTWENSRADRKLDGYVALRKALRQAGALWGYKDAIYDMSKAADRKRTAQDAVNSEGEADDISERNLRTHLEMSIEGSPPSGAPGWGFLRNRPTVNGKRVVHQTPNPETVPHIRTVAGMFLASESGKDILRYLKDNDVRTATGQPWTDLTKLRRAITKPSLAGLRVHQGKVVGLAEWNPVLDDDREEAVRIHRRLVALFTETVKARDKDSMVAHLLSGIARCGNCGSGATTRKSRAVYQCPRGCTTRPEEYVDMVVTEYVLRLLRRPDALKLWLPSDSSALDQAQAKLDELTTRLESFYTEAARGELSARGLATIEKDLLPQIERATTALKTRFAPEVVRDIAGPTAATDWMGLTIPQRRTVIRTVVTVRLDPLGSVKGAGRFSGVHVERKIAA